jgi:hypothetical protein
VLLFDIGTNLVLNEIKDACCEAPGAGWIVVHRLPSRLVRAGRATLRSFKCGFQIAKLRLFALNGEICRAQKRGFFQTGTLGNGSREARRG